MPGDFSEQFDLRKLDDYQRGEIEFVLLSPAYQHSFRPYIENMVARYQHLWKDRSQARKYEYPDDFLAGAVMMGEGLLAFFTLLINEADVERIHMALTRTPEEHYSDLQADGKILPVVGANENAEPELSPEEDF